LLSPFHLHTYILVWKPLIRIISVSLPDLN
jgi:hypothetical protein